MLTDNAQVISKTTKCQQELETRLKLPRVIHTTISIFVLCNLYSTDILVTAVHRRKKRNVPDLLVSHATSAGNRKRAAQIEVSGLYCFLSQLILMDGVTLIGHHHIPNTIMKKEPKSPSQPTTRKYKTFSATTREPIRYVNIIDEDPTASMQACRKRT